MIDVGDIEYSHLILNGCPRSQIDLCGGVMTVVDLAKDPQAAGSIQELSWIRPGSVSRVEAGRQGSLREISLAVWALAWSAKTMGLL